MVDNEHKFVFLGIDTILVQHQAGSYIPCQAVLGSESQLNFMTDRFVHYLGLERHKSKQKQLVGDLTA